MWTTTLLIAVVLSALMWCYKRKQRQKMFLNLGIPGPRPHFFTGNLHQMQAESIRTDITSRWLKEYGNIFGYFKGETPFLVINDVAILKDILIKDFYNFTNRFPIAKMLFPESIVSLRNSRWKEVRGILTPTFSASKIKTIFQIINNKVSSTIEVIADKAERNEEFDMYSISRALAFDVIADTILDMKINFQKNPQNPLYETVILLTKSGNNATAEFINSSPILMQILKYLMPFTIVGKIRDIISENLKNVIRHRRSHPNTRRKDLLQLMLNSSDSNSSESINDNRKEKVELTDKEIIDNAGISLFAGFETTAAVFAFIFHLLVQHSDVQEKLFDEISEYNLDERANNFTYETVSSLSYLDQVVNESLRMYSPPFFTRECLNDYPIGKYIIPKGTYVAVPVWHIHHDPKFWPDPWKFKPERFSAENKGKIDKISYLPFGCGPRNCIGMRLALLELKLAVARLVRKFKFVACEKTEIPVTLIYNTDIMRPKNGIYVRVISRT